MINTNMDRQSTINLAKSVPTAEAVKEVTGLANVQADAKGELQSVRNKFTEQLKASGRIDEVTSEIDIYDQNSIINFGKTQALKLSTIADDVIKSYDSKQITDSDVIINKLISIMEKVDVAEINKISQDLVNSDEKNSKNALTRFFNATEKKLNKIVAKYQTLSSDIEAITRELTLYEQQLNDRNGQIEDLYYASIENYKELLVYVESGKQALIEMKQYREELEQQQRDGDINATFNTSDIDTSIALMTKRINDLSTAEALALQSIPTYKIQEKTNNHMQMKLESAFITTLPALKNQIASAVLTKQQALQMRGMAALDMATNTLIEQGAINVTNQLKLAQEMDNTSGIKTETIEKSWNTIMSGIAEYKASEARYQQIREEEIKKRSELNEKYLTQVGNGGGL